MAIKDDPKTRVKAAEAKRAMEQGSAASHAYCMSLVNSYKLAGVVVINLNAGDDVGIGACCFDSRGRDILYEWAGELARHIPESVIERHGAYILAIRDDGEIDAATWGKTKQDCVALSAWAEDAWKYVSAAPFTTFFGFGNGGKPKRLAPADLCALTEHQRSYVRKNTHPDAY